MGGLRRTMPFEELIKKRDTAPRYPQWEQEPEQSFLLLFLYALAKGLKGALGIIGGVLKGLALALIWAAKLAAVIFLTVTLLPFVLTAAFFIRLLAVL